MQFEKEYEIYEKQNGGIFSINNFERMLLDIGIFKHLIILIKSYLKKLCQKDFLDFTTFKTLILQFSQGTNALISILFELIVYPKKNIAIDDFFNFIKQFEIFEQAKIGELKLK